jgi:hypothetical protein
VGPSNRNGQRRQKPVICRSWLVQMDVGRTLKVAIAAHTCRLKLAQHLEKWAHRRRWLRLYIEKTESQPRASAFFKLPNLVRGRSEGPQSALNVGMCMAQHLSLSAQTEIWYRLQKGQLWVLIGNVQSPCSCSISEQPRLQSSH